MHRVLDMAYFSIFVVVILGILYPLVSLNE